MPEPTLRDLAAFVAVATHRSFRRAADELGVSASSLSHTVRGLERRLGVRLLNRTTRSVSPTEAGDSLLERLRPILGELDSALAGVDAFRASPRGTLRINAPEPAARLLLLRVAPSFLADNPDVALDLVSEGRLVDIVAEGFDAGVRLAEAAPQDMIGVRFGGNTRFVAVASSTYLARAGIPATPTDLHDHACIRHRMQSGKIYRWEFERRGKAMAIDVPGPLTLNSDAMMLDAASAGMGIAFVSELSAAPYLADRRLRVVLEDWCPDLPGLVLYYPGHRHVSSALTAFIAIMRRSFSSQGEDT